MALDSRSGKDDLPTSDREVSSLTACKNRSMKKLIQNIWNELNDLYLKGYLYNKGREEYFWRCQDLLPSRRLAVKLKIYQFFFPAPAVGTFSSGDVAQWRPASTAVRSFAPDREERLVTGKYRFVSSFHKSDHFGGNDNENQWTIQEVSADTCGSKAKIKLE